RKNHYHPGIWATEAREGAEVAAEFAAFLKRHATLPMLSAQGRSFHVAQLVAHNAAFDGPFITTWFERLGIYLPARRLVLCTMQLAMWHFISQRGAASAGFRLATLCEHFGIPFHAAKAHEALGDVSATVRLFEAIAQES